MESMEDVARKAKNIMIADTMRATYAKRRGQICRVFTCKIQDNKLSNDQRTDLKMIFVEGKWLYNAIIAYGDREGRSISDYDTKSTSVIHKDKDGNDVTSTYSYLPQSLRQTIHAGIKSSLRVLATMKKRGYKVGALKFISRLESVDYKQLGVTHKILGKNRVKLQGVKGIMKVNGMDQFYGNPDMEIANAKLLSKPDGYYIAFTTWTDEDKIIRKHKNGRTVGVDFGIETSFTTSEGEKINAAVREQERIKRLQRKLAKQKKGSRRWWRTVRLLRIEYQKLTNRKDDLANKIIAAFTENTITVIQDEMLQHWHKGLFGKQVQHSVLGRVKAGLKDRDDVVVLCRSIPTTKLCTSCGKLNDMPLSKRTYGCECGIPEKDRDVHAAENMVWLYKHNVGVGRTEMKRGEIREAVEKALEEEQTRWQKDR